MSIRWKLGIIFLVISLVPLIIFSVIGFDRAQRILKQEIGLNFEIIAREKAMAVASVLNRRVDEAINLAKNPRIIAAVVDANSSFAEKGNDFVVREIKRIDRAWLQSKGDMPVARNVLGNDISDFLREYRSRDPLEYGEIFITDRLGATVAMTSTLTDYYQADEGWWREGFAGGKGVVYIDDRGLDLSVNAVVTGVIVPVRVNGEISGLLKINFKMAHIPAIITNPYEGDDVSVFMHRSNGTAVIDSTDGLHKTATETETRIMSEEVDAGWAEDDHDLEPTIMGYALVQPEKMIYSRFQSEKSRRGVAGENWGRTDWYVFVERNRVRAYAPLTKLIIAFIVGAVVIAITVVFVAGVTATTVTNPLVQLREEIEPIAAGNLSLKISSDRKDEIGDVMRDIGRMVRRLKETLASRDELNREIIERKRAEEELREREEDLIEAQRLAQIGNWNLDLTTNELTWSDEIYRIFGINKATFGASLEAFLDMGHPDDREYIEKEYKESVEKNYLYDIEHRIIRKSDGEVRWVHENCEHFCDEAGRVVRSAGTVQDVTDRKLAEAEFRKLSQAVEQSPAMVVITDTNGTIEYINPKFEEITGYSAEEAIGRNPRFLRSGETTDEEYAELWETITSGREWRGEFHNRHKDGSLFWEAVLISPIKSPDGTITNFLAVEEDVTERKNLEDQLRQAQKMEVVGQLTGGVAHDFNNLLTIMMGNSELMEYEIGNDENVRHHLEEIKRAVNKAASLTSRLLAFSRKQTLFSETTDLIGLIDGLGDMLRRTLGETIELRAEHAPDLWLATIDQHQFESALVNLAVNARDAMPKGGALTIETANITLDAAYAEQHEEVTPGNYVMVAVSDTGTGITPEVLEQVFEPFFTTKDVGEGSGLGLSMVYGFVKQSDGHLTITSEVGRGTTIELFFPRSQKAVAQAEPKEDSSVFELGSEHILIVEDDPDVRKVSAKILRAQGYEIIEAKDGKEAISQLKSAQRFDLLFTDVVLPGGKNGVEIAEEARRIQPGIKIIYTSGYAEDAIVHSGQWDPDVTLVNKPYLRADLLEKVRTVLKGESD